MARLDMQTMKDVLVKKIDISEIKTVYDIGCLNGADSFLLSELFNCDVVGFEGLPDNYEKFLRDKNTDKVSFHQIIIRNYDGKTQFYQKEQNGIHSIFEQNLSKTKDILVELECSRMDTFITKNNLLIPDLVKIDVEGATLEALESFGNLLNKIRVLQIETEELEYFNGQTLEPEVLEYVEKMGFFPIFKSSSINVKQNDYIMLNKIFYTDLIN
jgi:FkbM family methyltransferase